MKEFSFFFLQIKFSGPFTSFATKQSTKITRHHQKEFPININKKLVSDSH